MKVLIVLCAIVAVAVAARKECDALARTKVKAQWGAAFGVAHHRIDFSKAMWKAILIQAPEAKSLLQRVNVDDINSGMFVAHAIRVLGGLDIAISLLDQPDIFKSEMNHLYGQHKDRNIPKGYFDDFENALLKVVPASIGRCFDEDIWRACFGVIKEAITEGIE